MHFFVFKLNRKNYFVIFPSAGTLLNIKDDYLNLPYIILQWHNGDTNILPRICSRALLAFYAHHQKCFVSHMDNQLDPCRMEHPRAICSAEIPKNELCQHCHGNWNKCRPSSSHSWLNSCIWSSNVERCE